MCAVIASLAQNAHPRTTASRLVSLVIVMVIVTVVVMAMAMAMAGAASGQNAPHPDWATERWKAHWIACPDAPQRDAGIFHFRKSFELPDLPKEFRVHVSADNRFLLFVNGTRVGEGPASSDLGHWK